LHAQEHLRGAAIGGRHAARRRGLAAIDGALQVGHFALQPLDSVDQRADLRILGVRRKRRASPCGQEKQEERAPERPADARRGERQKHGADPSCLDWSLCRHFNPFPQAGSPGNEKRPRWAARALRRRKSGLA
jgi:hypothetical protein